MLFWLFNYYNYAIKQTKTRQSDHVIDRFDLLIVFIFYKWMLFVDTPNMITNKWHTIGIKDITENIIKMVQRKDTNLTILA